MGGEHEPLTVGEIDDAWSFVRLAMDEPSGDTIILLARLAATARVGAEAGARLAALEAENALLRSNAAEMSRRWYAYQDALRAYGDGEGADEGVIDALTDAFNAGQAAAYRIEEERRLKALAPKDAAS